MGRFKVLACVAVMLPLIGVMEGQSSSDRHVWLPFKVYRGYVLVVEGSIGGVPHRKLLIDTAAYPSVIDQDLARKLHLSSTSDELRVVGQNLKSEAAVVPLVQVGPVETRNLSVQVQDLHGIEKKLGTHVDALIGLDVLGQSSFRIDYERQQLVFGAVGVLQASAPLKQIDRMTYVDTELNGQVAHLLVGSAASNITVFGNVASKMRVAETKQLESTNLGGKVSLRQVHIDRLAVGGVDLGPREIQVTDSENLRTLPVDGLLSTGALGFGQVAFDFEHQVFSWEMAGKARNHTTALRDPRATNTGLPPIEGSDPMSTVASGCPSLQGSAGNCRSAAPRPQQPR
jgi:predicted aspartyl protease